MSDARCLLDASAVLAWLFKEQGEQEVDGALERADLSALNLTEVLYRAAAEGLPTDRLTEDLEALGVRIVPFTAEDAALAAEVKREAARQRIRLSLADCCCLGAGLRLGQQVLTADRVWGRLRLGVDVHLVR